MSDLTCPNGECEHSTAPQVERDYSLRGRGGALLRVYCPSCALHGPLANTEADAIRMWKLLLDGEVKWRGIAKDLAGALDIAERIIRSEWAARPIPSGPIFDAAIAAYRDAAGTGP